MGISSCFAEGISHYSRVVFFSARSITSKKKALSLNDCIIFPVLQSYVMNLIYYHSNEKNVITVEKSE